MHCGAELIAVAFPTVKGCQKTADTDVGWDEPRKGRRGERQSMIAAFLRKAFSLSSCRVRPPFLVVLLGVINVL